jgi:hypothetical protein
MVMLGGRDMSLLKSVGLFLLGLALIGLVVFLGLRVNEGPFYVVAFGIASALVAPIGLSSIGYAVGGRDRHVLERLSQVPEINRLIEEANTQAEKVRLLQEDRARLLETVQIEARREGLLQQRERLERDGVQLLRDLENVERELATLQQATEASPAAVEIARLHERLRARRRGDIVIRMGRRDFVLDPGLLAVVPGAALFIPYFRVLARLSEIWTRILAPRASPNKRAAADGASPRS